MANISQIGRFYEKKVLQTKYGFSFSMDQIAVNVRRLTNQLWKLIPMRENKEDWKKQLNTDVIEIAGLYEIFNTPHFLQLLSKLEGVRAKEINFELYRKTIFECISLLQELNRDIRL